MFFRRKPSANSEGSDAMSSPSKNPFATKSPSRTRSLRERFASKRSYSENFVEPPAPPSSAAGEGGRSVRPSLPIIGVPPPESFPGHHQHERQHVLPTSHHGQQTSVLSEHFNPFAALPEETYCSALDINSQEGDPRFPWQRDVAVQCDLEDTDQRTVRRDSFFMANKDESLFEKRPSISLAPAMVAPSVLLNDDLPGQSLQDKFKETHWHNLSICAEEEETPPQHGDPDPFKEKKKKKTTMLQRALSERSRTRRLTCQQSADECRPPELGEKFSPHHIPPFKKKESTNGTYLRDASPSSAPTSRTETPPSGNSSPQTPPPSSLASPSRRNSRRRGFVRKNTHSAPDSFDRDDDPPTISLPPSDEPPERPPPYQPRSGYFNFDSMQRLLDLSITASTRPEKPSFLLTPGGLAVGKDKNGTYMTLPSPNVQNAEDSEGGSGAFRKLSEDEESELEDRAPPASALHRRQALVPPKMLPDEYESATEETDHSPNGPTTSSGEHTGAGRRSSVVVIPPMQVCPGDLLVYSKVLTQRNSLLENEGSTQNLSVTEDSSKKGKNTWSLLRLFDRSNRSKADSLGELEEVLSSLRPSEFIDEHLSKYKGMPWTEFVELWRGQRARKEAKGAFRQQSTKWLNFSEPTPTHTVNIFDSTDGEPRCTEYRQLSVEEDSTKYTTVNSHQVGTYGVEGGLSALDEIGHHIESLDAMARCRSDLKRREALWDLFQSECMFLYDHLMILKNVYMEPLKKIQVEGFAMFAEPEVLFGNLDELCCVTYSFCKEFLSLILQKACDEEVHTTEILVKLLQKSSKAKALKQAYHRYTLNYINALNYLESLRRQAEFNEFEKWCSRDVRCKKLQLTDLLVSPVQHVMRVPLLLKEIEIRTEETKEKSAIVSIIEGEENSLRELDDKMKWLKNFERLLEIQRSIVWPSVSELDSKAFIPDFLRQPLAKQPCERLIVSPRRQIVLEGSLQLLDSGKPSETFVVLFDDMLLITRRKKGLHKKKSSITENWASATSNKNSSPHEPGYKYVVYKQPLSLDRFFIHDVSQQDAAASSLKNTFVLVVLNRFQQIVTVHTFQAPNDTVKSLWLSKLRDTIDRWKRTLQNTVFRNQRSSTNTYTTPMQATRT